MLGNWEKGLLMAAFLLIACLIGWDLVEDFRAGGGPLHLIMESIVFVASLCGSIVLARFTLRTRQTNQRLKTDLALAQTDLAQWKEKSRSYVEGLHAMIETQFNDWNLTPAEKEVGYFLLKGFSFKEVAGLRQTSERTVRQQSQALYRKANLSGRAEFSAFFLEDLLSPALPPQD